MRKCQCFARCAFPCASLASTRTGRQNPRNPGAEAVASLFVPVYRSLQGTTWELKLPKQAAMFLVPGSKPASRRPLRGPEASEARVGRDRRV